MSKRKTIIFIVLTFLSGSLAYMNLKDFYSSAAISFLIVGSILGVMFTINKKAFFISPLICIGCGFAGGGVCGGITALCLCLTGIVLGALILRKSSMIKVLISGAVGIVISLLISAVCFRYVKEVDVLASFFEYIKSSVYEFLKSLFIVMEEDFSESALKSNTETYFLLIKNLLPGMVGIYSIISSLFALLFYRVIHKIAKIEEEFKFSFSMLMCDKVTGAVFIICFLCALLMKNGPIMTAFTNIYMIIFFVLQICGLSLIDSIMKKRSFHIVLRVFLLGTLVIFSSGFLPMLILTLSAIIDSFKNFRKIGISAEENQDKENNM